MSSNESTPAKNDDGQTLDEAELEQVSGGTIDGVRIPPLTTYPTGPTFPDPNGPIIYNIA